MFDSGLFNADLPDPCVILVNLPSSGKKNDDTECKSEVNPLIKKEIAENFI